ncbi:MAG: substrate-binding domain-containing protein [Aestuariivita sp.]|nr:substrate-binding domain-containing protein [Aestuariivita sp.]
MTTSSSADQLRMAVTTSFHNSGLASILLPEIKKDIGLTIQLLVVGTGQAIKLGKAGDVDAILVHSKSAEQALVDSGYVLHRREIMFNDFVIVGPSSDPANVRKASTAVEAMQAIASAKSTFVSRGDDSGTHLKERDIWIGAGLDPVNFEHWYWSVGAGMGVALNTATAQGAYIFTDRASWLNFKNKADQILLFQGDPILFNQYAYLPVNPSKHPHVKANFSTNLENWLTSKRAEALINGYKINNEKLFFFNAKR